MVKNFAKFIIVFYLPKGTWLRAFENEFVKSLKSKVLEVLRYVLK